MSDPYLTVTSSFGTVAFNGVASNGAGVEAQPGATGLGLPPIEATFNTGAGDGSMYVGRRVNSRTMDIPVTILAEDRADLSDQMRNLSKVVTAEGIVLRWIEPGVSSHRLNVQLVGGGDYIYGEDTTGSHYARTTFTFQSEDPYWENEETVEVSSALPDPEVTISVENEGSVAVEPVYVVTGPTDGFDLKMGDRVLTYARNIQSGAQVIVNTGKGTVTDPNGNNLYGNLGPAPSFITLPAGQSELTVTTREYVPPLGEPSRRNHFPNPNFTNGYHGITFSSLQAPYFSREMEGSDWGVARGEQSGIITESRFFTIYAEGPWDVTDDIVIEFDQINTLGGKLTVILRDSNGSAYAIEAVPLLHDATGARFRQSHRVGSPVRDATDQLYIQVSYDAIKRGHGHAIWKPSWFGKLYIGKPGGDFFSGDTPDTESYDYSWEGSPNASHSLETPIPPSPGSANDPHISISFNPREWLVI